jgi:hypothetical protein
MYFISFRKVFYRIPELHNVLIYRILFDRIQSPQLDQRILYISLRGCLLYRIYLTADALRQKIQELLGGTPECNSAVKCVCFKLLNLQLIFKLALCTSWSRFSLVEKSIIYAR